MSINNRKIFLYFPLMILIMLPLHGTSKADLFSGDVHFSQVTVADGLSQMTVLSIYQDQQGFMWFGTQDGLNRYDGYEFTIYRTIVDDPNSISSNYISSIYQDSFGFIWVGTPNGLNRFESKTKTFKRFLHDPKKEDSISHNRINTIIEDKYGVLWIGTAGGGLNRYNAETETFTAFRSLDNDPETLQSNYINSLKLSDDGRLWVGSGQSRMRPKVSHGGIDIFDTKTHRVQRLALNAINSRLPKELSFIYLMHDSKGNLWAGTYGQGVIRYSKAKNTIEHFYPNENESSITGKVIVAIAEDHAGKIWLGTQMNGLSYFDPPTNRFVSFSDQSSELNSVKSTDIASLFVDKAGIVWIGTWNGSLHKYNRFAHRIIRYSVYKDRLGNMTMINAQGIAEDSPNKAWIAGYDKGLYHVDLLTGEMNHFNVSIKGKDTSPIIRNLFKDRSNQLWGASKYSGLLKLVKDGKKMIAFEANNFLSQGNKHQHVLMAFEDKAGHFWVGTRGGGVIRYHPKTSEFQQFNKENTGVNIDNVDAILEDSRGLIWLGTEDAGLAIYEPQTQRFLFFMNSDSPILHDGITSLIEGSNGEVWVSSSGGINKVSISGDAVFSNNIEKAHFKFEQFTTKDGLATDATGAIVQDSNGLFWISTTQGISRLNAKTREVVNYDYFDGVIPGGFWINSFYHGSNGIIYFGGPHGLNAFDPRKIKTDKSDTPIQITDFRLFNQKVDISTKNKLTPLTFAIEETTHLTLDHNQYVFSFGFSGLNYGAPFYNQYRYRLVGFNQDWIYTDSVNRRATFTNLNSGHYQFHVQASNRDGIWSSEVRTVNLEVLPPPWKTWWAYTFYFLLIAFIVFRYLKSQEEKVAYERSVVAKLRQVDRLKDEFLANTSHELRTPLNGMIGLTESLIEGVHGDLDKAVVHELSMVAKSGRRLAHLVADILDFSKMKNHVMTLNQVNVDLHSLVDVVLTLLKPLVIDKPVKLINNVDVNTRTVFADEIRMQQILNNLVGNAIKFTESGNITVSAIENKSGYVDLVITDTGIGIPEEKFEAIFQSFEQGDGSSSRQYGGTGLGLAISKQLVELHNGYIWVESTIGKGSRFFIRLPCSGDAIEQSILQKKSSTVFLENNVDNLHDSLESNTDSLSYEENRSSADSKDERENNRDGLSNFSDLSNLVNKGSIDSDTLKPFDESNVENSLTLPNDQSEADFQSGEQFTILIVDDDSVNRRVIRNQLFHMSYNIIEAGGGEEAIAILTERPNIDLVLLDVMMPKVSGFEVCSVIRKQRRIHELPIIFLTAMSQVDDLLTSFNVGANDYLTKPVSKHELDTRVRLHLKMLDIHRNLEAKIKERTLDIVTIADIGREITSGLEMESILESVYNGIKQLMPVNMFGLGILNEEKNTIDYKYSIADGVRYKPYFRDGNDKNQLAVWCVDNKLPIKINDAKIEVVEYLNGFQFEEDQQGSFELEDGTKAKQPLSILYVPIKLQDKILGVISVQDFEVNQYQDVHLDMLQSIASYTAIALQNAIMHEELQEAYNKVEQMSLTDPLTGLHNRRFLMSNIDTDVAFCNRQFMEYNRTKEYSDSLPPDNADLNFFLVDIDWFKQVNDSFGHAAGDELLIQVRRILEQTCRESDMIIRWGGEEFLIFARFQSRKNAPILAERIRSAFEKHTFVIEENTLIDKTVSIGFASYPFDKDYPEQMSWSQVIEVADRCLYAVKRSSRNGWIGLEHVNHSYVDNLFSSVIEFPEKLLAESKLAILTSIDNHDDIEWG